MPDGLVPLVLGLVVPVVVGVDDVELSSVGAPVVPPEVASEVGLGLLQAPSAKVSRAMKRVVDARMAETRFYGVDVA